MVIVYIHENMTVLKLFYRKYEQFSEVTLRTVQTTQLELALTVLYYFVLTVGGASVLIAPASP